MQHNHLPNLRIGRKSKSHITSEIMGQRLLRTKQHLRLWKRAESSIISGKIRALSVGRNFPWHYAKKAAHTCPGTKTHPQTRGWLSDMATSLLSHPAPSFFPVYSGEITEQIASLLEVGNHQKKNRFGKGKKMCGKYTCRRRQKCYLILTSKDMYFPN